LIGQTISHYKITDKLGEGGMGVVYKAEDTKLERTVALKFLAAHLLNDEEAKARFLREAKAAAALHHPNVCPVYEIDEVDGRTFLAMAFLKGETLEERIVKGPLPIKDALDIARQVAEGLQAAHTEEIVHRDIKPANILVSPEGRPTIMDFGLARLTEASRLTKADQTMGTVAYMSPEQAQGMGVDHRSDVWSLGCVLYEMVSGQRPFLGQYDQALLYEIVHEEVAPLTSIRAGVPMELELLVGECLAKDRDDRTSTAHEVARKLRTLAEKLKSGRSTILRTSQMTGTVPATMTGAHTLNPAATLPPDAVIMKRSSQRGLQGLAALLGIALLVLGFVHFTQAPDETVEQQVTRFSFSPEGVQLASISPDGKNIVYPVEQDGQTTFWVRSLASETTRELAGTEGTRYAAFWSPDGLTIVFGTDTELKRVSLDGGNPVTLCKLPRPRVLYPFLGAAWSPDGQRIVFSSGGGLFELAAVGGDPKLLFERAPGEQRTFYWAPSFLPPYRDRQAIVYVADNGDDRMLSVMDLESGDRRELVPGVWPQYSSEGYLVYGPAADTEVGLRALPFSLETLSAAGEAFPIEDAGRFASVSNSGTLVYVESAPPRSNLHTLVWRDRKGEDLGTIGQPQPNMGWPKLSPDGHRVAVTSNEGGNNDIWVHDVTRSTKTRLTSSPGQEEAPVWSSSGQEIVYGARGAGIERKAADGTGDPTVLTQSGRFPDLSRDGRYLVYQDSGGATEQDIFYVELSPDGGVGEPIAFLSEPAAQVVPKLSRTAASWPTFPLNRGA
jgi:serine/threonine protein kinase